MKKKEYIKPNMQVLHVTPCTILAKSFLEKGKSGNDNPQQDEDGWYWSE